MKRSTCQFLMCGMLAALLLSCSSNESHSDNPARGQTGAALAGPALPAQTKPQPAPGPAEQSPRRSDKVETVVRVVLDAHGFVPPVLIEGQDASRWAVSTRPGSAHELVLASVKMGPGNQVSVELLLYAYVGSTWALLGHEFRGLADQEARQMSDQIRERLAQ